MKGREESTKPVIRKMVIAAWPPHCVELMSSVEPPPPIAGREGYE